MSSSNNNKARALEERRKLAEARAARFATPAKTEEQLAAEKAARNSKKAENNAAAARKAEKLAAERAAKLAEREAQKKAQNAAIAQEKAAMSSASASRSVNRGLAFPEVRPVTRKLPQTLEEYQEIIQHRKLDDEEIKHFSSLVIERERMNREHLHRLQNNISGDLNTVSQLMGEVPSHEIFQNLQSLPARIKVRYDTKNFSKQSGRRGLYTIPSNNVRESVERKFGSNSRLYKFERLSNNNLNTVKTRSKKYNNTDTSRLKMAFLGHGLSSEDFVIVPEGYSVTFYTECGLPLSVDEMLDSYYTNSSKYKHTYHEGSVFNNLKLFINPEMGLRTTEYVGVLPIKNGEIPREAVPECPNRERILTDSPAYQYPSFYNINHKDPKNHAQYCSALDLYNYNIGSRLSQLNGRNTTLRSVRDRSGEKMELDSFIRKIRNSYPLLELISKDRDPSELFRMFDLKEVRMTTRSASSSSPFNDFELDKLLYKIKPGDYHFYMCRSYDDERLNTNGKKTKKISTLSRQRSITKCQAGQMDPDPETTPIFNYFGGDDGKIAVLARFIENVLIPLVSDPGMIPFYSSLPEEYAEESGRSFSDYVNTFLKYTVSTRNSPPSLDDLMNPTNKIYSRFVNMRDGDARGNRKFITFKNDVVLTISPRDIEVINNLILLMYHLLVRINNNIFKLSSGYTSEDLLLAQTVIISMLEISTLNPKLFVRESMDKFFHKIKINSRYYNMLHVEISNSTA